MAGEEEADILGDRLLLDAARHASQAISASAYRLFFSTRPALYLWTDVFAESLIAYVAEAN